jgi:hypothetical protein
MLNQFKRQAQVLVLIIKGIKDLLFIILAHGEMFASKL